MQVGDEFVVMVETTITANGKTIENPIIKVTRPQAAFNPRFVYFVDNQTVGQPRHWYVGDGKGNVVVSDINVVDSTTSTALATALTDQLTAAGYLSGSHTGTVSDVPGSYNKRIDIHIVTPSWDDLANDTFIYLNGTVNGFYNPVLIITDKDEHYLDICLALEDNVQYVWSYNGTLTRSAISRDEVIALEEAIASLMEDGYGFEFTISNDIFVQSDIQDITKVTILI